MSAKVLSSDEISKYDIMREADLSPLPIPANSRIHYANTAGLVCWYDVTGNNNSRNFGRLRFVPKMTLSGALSGSP